MVQQVQTVVLAGRLLSGYPMLYNYVTGRREDIIHGYRQGCFGSIRSSGGVSDPVLSKVVRLDELSRAVLVGRLVRRWIDYELQPEDRPVLLAVWRGAKLDEGRWRHRWETMTDNLAGYMSQSVLTACGPVGLASVGILSELIPA